MNEKTLYEDKNITITNRRIISAQKSILLVTIREVDIRQIKDPSNMYKAFMYAFAWGLLSILLDVFTPIPTVFLFISGGGGIWWLFERAWPYAIVANTQKGEEIVFLSHDQKHIEKITYILCETLGIELPQKMKR